MSFIVAIDGPAGTGKGTITKLIAKDFGLINIVRERHIDVLH